MHKRIFLGILFVGAAALSHGKGFYKVQGHETIEGIAKRFGVSSRALLEANPNVDPKRIRPGMKLSLPSEATSTKIASTGSYKIRNGDNDWSLAVRYGTSRKELQRLNPGVDLEHIKPGQMIKVPSGGKSSSSPSKSEANRNVSAPEIKVKVSSTKGSSKPTAKTVSAKSSSTVKYKVREGDNDWVIARRFDTRVKNLKALNPSVNFSALRAGTVLTVPNLDGSANWSNTRTESGKIVPASSKAGTIKTLRARIVGDNVNIRRTPSTSGDVITTVDDGIIGKILDREGNWYKLRFPKGTEAWVRGDFLKPVSTTAVVAEREKARPTATKKSSSSSRVATNSSSKSKSRPDAYSRSPRNASRTIAKASSSKASGRVASKAKSSSSKRTVAANYGSGSGGRGDVVSAAYGWIGTRYRWGGQSRGGTDCSGFVGSVYRSKGVSLPRTAAEMSKRGQAVSKSSLTKGDLVFFKTRGNRVSHVGMYVGDGKFIHASSGKGHVTVSSLNEGYYQRRYAGAKRVASGSSKSSSSKSSSSKAAPKKQEERTSERKATESTSKKSRNVGTDEVTK